uniref:Uncharacterized protein n=1 Tax=Rhizophora mucronata TaxID=61149 RepID=A0A2P2PI01_RHIMU
MFCILMQNLLVVHFQLRVQSVELTYLRKISGELFCLLQLLFGNGGLQIWP